MKSLRAWLFLLGLICVAEFALSSSSSAADFSALWDGGNGNWDDPLHWNSNPNYPNNGGGFTYDATINSGNVTLDRDITIQRLFLSGGFSSTTLGGAFALTLNEGLNWSGGTIGSTTINLTTGSVSSITGSSHLLQGVINNSGTVNQNRGLIFTGIINNQAGATWKMTGVSLNPYNGMVTPPAAGQFNNAGILIVSSSAVSDFVALRTTFNNSGYVSLVDGVDLSVGGTSSGSYNLAAQTNLSISGTLTAGAISGAGTTNVSALDITGNASISTNLIVNGRLSVESGATLTLAGTVSNSLQAEGSRIQMNGGTITSSRVLDFSGLSSGIAGVITGSGTINADVIARDIEPGISAAGKLTINGSLTLLETFPRPVLWMDIGGLTQGTEYDYLDVNGSLSLSGNLLFTMLNHFEFQLQPDQIFTLVTSDNLTGAFSNVANGGRIGISYVPSGLEVSFQVNYGAGSPYGANNVVLSDPRVVPEPASLVLFTGGIVVFGFALFLRR